jgi:hypothetical protein
MFGRLPPYVEDQILSLFVRYQADPRPNKVNLGIGAALSARTPSTLRGRSEWPRCLWGKATASDITSIH